MRWILLIFLCLCSCTSSPPRSNCLRISFNTRPNTLDPARAGDFVSSTVICMIYEGLTRCVPGGAVEPALAEDVLLSNDLTTYTFRLRKAEWSDGSPITAHDFEASWKQLLITPRLCTYLLYPIKNAEKCAKGQICIDEVGIRAVDDFTLQVTLERPTPYFYSLTAFPTFLPTHRSGLTVCSGPFLIEKNGNASEIKLAKNPSYWNADGISLNEIHISIIPDEMTALQMFERGDLDWIGGPLSPLPPDAVEKMKDQISFVSSAATTLCTFNTERFPFNNAHLRKAFSYAINRSEIVEHVTQNDHIPAESILPPCFALQSHKLSNEQAAKEHLQKALFELQIAPESLEQLVLYYKPGQVEKRLAQTLQKQWKETLGIKVQLIQLDFKSHAHRLQTRDYQISLATWIAQFDDPVSILERFKSRSNLKNYPGWEDARYAQVLEEAYIAEDREDFLMQAESILADQMPLTPIYHWSSPILCSPRIQSIGSTPCGGILFERFEINER